MLGQIVESEYEVVGEGGVSVVISGETIFAGIVVYVEERDAIDRFREAVVVGDEVWLCEEAGDEVRWKGGKSKFSQFSHVGVSTGGEVGECEYGVRQSM